MLNINKKFQPSFFSNTDVNSILSSDEQKILIIEKNKGGLPIYDTFNEDFGRYLDKMPDNVVKECCRNLLNKNLIYLGIAKVKPDNVIVRSLITTDDKFAGIILDSQQLGIDPTTGSTDSIDECVYASYFGFIRSAVLINKNEIRQNKDLHKLLSTYLYLLFLKAIGSDKIYSEKQKLLVHALSIYIYYKHYLKERHPYILTILERDYGNFIGKENLEEFSPVLEKMKNYTTLKEFPKMLIDAKVINESPNVLIMSLLRMLKPMGFYSLVGPLDYFVPMVIIAKYPINFISDKVPTNSKIQDAVEEIMMKYIDKLKYDLTAVERY
ncbi:MAG TPA: hypothetical protein PLL26_06595 [Candidatus Dojkabacteria bacterium]|nr:hypothetical protein [Candidatus Dojkabacteria bacterium]